MQGMWHFGCFHFQLRECCQLPSQCCSFSIMKCPPHGMLKLSVCLQNQGRAHTWIKPLHLAMKASQTPPLVQAEHK